MATSFTLTDPKAVTFKVDYSHLPPGPARYYLASKATYYPDLFAEFTLPDGGLSAAYFYATTVLPPGTYTIAEDAGAVHINVYGVANYVVGRPIDFLVSV